MDDTLKGMIHDPDVSCFSVSGVPRVLERFLCRECEVSTTSVTSLVNLLD